MNNDCMMIHPNAGEVNHKPKKKGDSLRDKIVGTIERKEGCQ